MNILRYNCVDSTNKEAKRNRDLSDGTVFVADMQNDGRGRLGRTWNSEKNSGIYMSILLKPKFQPDKIPQITLAAGLAVCRAIRNAGLDAYIKWPNDIIVNKKKICGILAETVFEGDNACCIVGIGVNVNTSVFKDELADKATSFLIESGKEYNKDVLIDDILLNFENIYHDMSNNDFINEYKKLCITLNKKVTVILPDGKYDAYAENITSAGELVVNKDGKTVILNSNEVSVRGLLGYI